MLRMLKESKFKAYKISIRQQLTDVDRQRRVEMAEWFEQHPEILENVWFTDEAHFWLSGQDEQSQRHALGPEQAR